MRLYGYTFWRPRQPVGQGRGCFDPEDRVLDRTSTFKPHHHHHCLWSVEARKSSLLHAASPLPQLLCVTHFCLLSAPPYISPSYDMSAPQQHEEPLQAADPPAIPLPPPPNHVLTAEQWGIFAAIADTVVPSFTPARGNRLLQHPLRADEYATVKDSVQRIAGAPSDDLIDAYLNENATAQSEFRNSLLRMIGYQMDDTAKKGFLFILNALK